MERFTETQMTKLKVFVENGLSSISKFTESFLTNSSKIIASRMKPTMFLAENENSITKEEKDGSREVADTHRSKKRRRLQMTSTDGGRLDGESLTKKDRSPKKAAVGYACSFIEGEVSLTQVSQSKGTKAFGSRKVKRTRKDNNLEYSNYVDEHKTPLTSTKRMKEAHPKDMKKYCQSYLLKENKKEGNENYFPLTKSSKVKKKAQDEALCVTPHTKTSKPNKKNSVANQKQPFNIKSDRWRTFRPRRRKSKNEKKKPGNRTSDS